MRGVLSTVTLQAAPSTPRVATSRAFVPLVAAAGFSMSLTAPLEVLFARDIGYGTALLSLFMLTSSCGVILVDVLGTRMIPALDARACVAVGTLLFALACLGMAVTGWWPLMMVVRVLQGFGSGVFMGSGLQASSRMSPEHTGRAVGRYNTAFLLGCALGSPGGLLMAAAVHGEIGYRLAFGFAGLLAALVALGVWLVVPALPAPGHPRPQLGLPRFDKAPGTVAALLLAMVGDFLRGGVLFCALPLLGAERGYGTLTIGVAIGLMASAEILMLGIVYRLIPRIGLVGVLRISLAIGLVCSVALAVDGHELTYLVVATVFGGALAGKTIGLPLMVVGRVGESAAGLARFRISAGIGMMIGATGCAAIGDALGGGPLFWAVAAVLVGGLALLATWRRSETPHPAPAAAK